MKGCISTDNQFWCFCIREDGNWYWERKNFETGEITGESCKGYENMDDCIADARQCGMDGEIK